MKLKATEYPLVKFLYQDTNRNRSIDSHDYEFVNSREIIGKVI